MRVKNIKEVTGQKLSGGSLPDIDSDFDGRGRAEIKRYIEDRFGTKQVVSVGTYTTLRPKGIIKDLDRQFDNDYYHSNLMTSIIEEKDITMLDIFKRAAKEPRLKKYIKQQSDMFHLMPTILDQPKTKSIHACAMIIFPDLMESYNWVPVRKQKGLIVTEWGGGEMDAAGFLKEDILGIKQLTKFADILKLIEKNGETAPDIYNLPNDKEIYRYFSNGFNCDIFQFGSEGLIEYSKKLKPQSFEDLIAANALYRPGPMENYYHTTYAKCKNGEKSPKYLWGTRDITKDTYGLLVYQEQIMEVCQKLGNLTMKQADDVRRAMGKKKISVLKKSKELVKKGFLENGCPLIEFEEIWKVMLEFAKYSFNRSHAAAYALTAYVGMYLKVHYPLEFWTVSLYHADEEKTLRYLSEIHQAKDIQILPPDINVSKMEMFSDTQSDNIFWGIGSIKGIGEDTANQIIDERDKNGEYKDFSDFLNRHLFKGSKVKKQTYEALISAGAFDRLYDFEGNESKRNELIQQYRKDANKKPSNPKRDPYTIGTLDKDWWWLMRQKELTGLAFIDYKKIAKSIGIETPFCTNSELSQSQSKGIFRAFGGYVVECKVSRGKRGAYARLTIEHNYKMFKLVIWSDVYTKFKDEIKGSERSIIAFNGNLKYEAKWVKENQFTLTDASVFMSLR